jgi:excisionase family DNA binding protein
MEVGKKVGQRDGCMSDLSSMSINRAAKITGQSRGAILRAIHIGELPAIRHLGQVRIAGADLAAWLRASNREHVEKAVTR